MIALNPYEEELAIQWTQSLDSDFHKNPFYKKNFSYNFLLSLKSRENIEELNFDEIDFTSIQKYLENKKENDKN